MKSWTLARAALVVVAASMALTVLSHAHPFLSAGEGEGSRRVLSALGATFFIHLATERRGWPPSLWALVGLVLAGLLVQGLVLVLIAWTAIRVVGELRAERAERPPTWDRSAIATSAALLVILAAFAPVPSPRPPPAGDLLQRSAWEAERHNLWQARAFAIRATKLEARPGSAHLRLAEIDVQLGRIEKARKVLAKVEVGGNEVDRREAAALIERLGKEEP